MENEWVEVAYVNDKIILHGQLSMGHDGFGVNIDQEFEISLDTQQKEKFYDLMNQHRAAMKDLVREILGK